MFDKYIVRQPKGINQRYDELNKVCDWINDHWDIYPHEARDERKLKI